MMVSLGSSLISPLEKSSNSSFGKKSNPKSRGRPFQMKELNLQMINEANEQARK
jgi:hypothetical protein